MKTCEVEGCLKKSYAHKMCIAHYGRRRRGADLTAPMRPKAVPIFGVRPKENEKCIYYLRRSDGIPFYVGSTADPEHRLIIHRCSRKDSSVEMVILRCCPNREEVYWEAKTLVEFIEAGYELENSIVPVKGKS